MGRVVAGRVGHRLRSCSAFAWPDITVLALVLAFGAYSLLDGILGLAMAVGGKDTEGSNRFVIGLMALFSIAAGILAFLWPEITAVALLWVIAAWAIATGVLEIILAVRFRKEITNEWLWVLSGILSVVLGLVLVFQPAVGALGLVTTIGVFSIAWGVILVALAFKVRRLATTATPKPPERSEVLGRLAAAETGEFVAMFGEEFPYLLGPGSGILPQSPADGLADEELLLVGPPQAKVEEHGLVGRFLVPVLTENRRSSQPHVFAFDPSFEDGPHPKTILEDDLANDR